MGMGFAPTWLRQVSPPASQNHFNHCSCKYKYKYKYKIKTYNAPYVTRVIRRRGKCRVVYLQFPPTLNQRDPKASQVKGS